MIGVDVVDLDDLILKKRNPQDLRFIVNEHDVPPEFTDPNMLYWTIWAAKESIFKSARIKQVFDPKEISVHFTSNQSFQSGVLSGKCMVYDSKIATYCHKPDITIIAEFFKIKGDVPSREVREILNEKLEKTGWKLDQQNNLPVIKKDGATAPVSLSHHFQYGAFGYPEQAPISFDQHSKF